MTECPECSRAEMTRWERVRADLNERLNRPSPMQAAILASVTTWRVMLGTPETGPTWYEKHRDLWEKTGDVRELERMTRHVS